MNDPTAKLYAQLTPAELGVLAVKYLVAGDKLELGKIKAACPRQSYQMQDARYLDTIEGFIRMSNAWGLLYWQHQHSRMKAALRLSIALNREMETSENEEAVYDCDAALRSAESCLLALDAALDEACATNGFDAADVRVIVAAHVFLPRKKSKAEPDAEIQAEVKDLLICILQDKS